MRAFAQLYDYSVNTVHTSIYDAGTVRWLATRIQSPRSTLGVTCVVLLHNFITHSEFLSEVNSLISGHCISQVNCNWARGKKPVYGTVYGASAGCGSRKRNPAQEELIRFGH